MAPVILTEYIDELLVNHRTERLPVPLKAAMLLPVQSNLALNETLTFSFYDYGGHHIADVFYKQSNTSTMAPIPITGDIAFIRVKNDAGNANAAIIRLPYQLAM